MTRGVLTFIFFVLVVSCELSFVTSLPYPFSVFPCVIAVSSYLVQTKRFDMAILWVAFFGVLQDVIAIAFVPFATVSYVVAAGCMMFAARSLFTNRSVYGVAGTAIATLLALNIVEILTLLIVSVSSQDTVVMSAYLDMAFWRIVTTAIFFLLLYPIQKILNTFFKNLNQAV